jgi:CRISP-associated protein Cas1
MWWLSDPQDLHRIEDRLSSVYIERCHIDRDDNAIVVVNKERTIRLPAAMVASLMLGPGTRITHAAIRLLSDSGTAVCWVGEHGVRMYATGLGISRGSQLIQRQAYLVTRIPERLAVARRMYQMRFPGEDVSDLNMQQLRGREGARIKRLYRDHSKRTGVPWGGRVYVPGEAFEAGDSINRLLSACNSYLYAVCHAAIVGLGASPALGFVHTGGSTSFVLDIADLYKAETTIPLSFDLAAKGLIEEREARTAFRDAIATGKLMSRIVRDIKDLLLQGEEQADADEKWLWDGSDGFVSGGFNWANRFVEGLSETDTLGITGPPVTEIPW